MKLFLWGTFYRSLYCRFNLTPVHFTYIKLSKNLFFLTEFFFITSFSWRSISLSGTEDYLRKGETTRETSSSDVYFHTKENKTRSIEIVTGVKLIENLWLRSEDRREGNLVNEFFWKFTFKKGTGKLYI